MSKITMAFRTRPCIITNKNTGETESAIFHMWFLAPDGWPMALVELSNGKMISVGYKRIQFVQEEDERDTFEFLEAIRCYDRLNREDLNE